MTWKLVEKIEEELGDVYKARLKQNQLPAAVKTCKVTLPDEQKKKSPRGESYQAIRQVCSVCRSNPS